MSSPRNLSLRRSKLRWRLSYLALSLLGFILAKWALTALLSLRTEESISGVVLSGLYHHVSPHRAAIAQGVVWFYATVVTLMVVTVAQLYRVGSGAKESIPSNRCPACGGRLKRHTISRGKAAGQSFLACEHHPKCDYSHRPKKKTTR